MPEPPLPKADRELSEPVTTLSIWMPTSDADAIIKTAHHEVSGS